MHNFADQHGSLPPFAIMSPEGKPLLSWRILLLPYLEHQKLLDEFHLDEPWDSPHNLTLLPKMPRIFEHFHGRTTPQPYTTYYRVFVGPGAAFDGSLGVSLKGFADGTSNTLLIVEAAEAVPWTKPDELPFLPDRPLPALGGHFPEVFVAALSDGSVRTVQRKLSDESLRAAITRSGGDNAALGPDW